MFLQIADSVLPVHTYIWHNIIITPSRQLQQEMFLSSFAQWHKPHSVALAVLRCQKRANCYSRAPGIVKFKLYNCIEIFAKPLCPSQHKRLFTPIQCCTLTYKKVSCSTTNLFISPSTIIFMAQRARRQKHYFDRREALIVVIVLFGSIAMFGGYEPSANVVVKDIACSGAASDGYCDYSYKNRCEAGCPDCDECLQYCTNVCAEQGKFVDYCTSNYFCQCTDENPCIR